HEGGLLPAHARYTASSQATRRERASRRSLRAHDRRLFVLRIASLVALCLFAIWAVFAWDAGAIDFVTMGWTLPLAFALAFILTREFRFQGKVVSVFEMMMLLSGQLHLGA